MQMNHRILELYVEANIWWIILYKYVLVYRTLMYRNTLFFSVFVVKMLIILSDTWEF